MRSYIRQTIDTYDAIASDYLEKWRDGAFESEWLHSFSDALPRGAAVVDLGSGPGRDSAELRRLGLNPICIDRSIEMLRAGASEYANERVLGDITSLPVRDASIFGIWANASLLHLSPEEFARGIAEIRRILVTEGRLYLSLKEGIGSKRETKQWGKPRWFQYWQASDLDEVLESCGFAIEKSGKEQTPNDSWLVRLCALRN